MNSLGIRVPPHRWCIVQSDNRPRDPLTAYWSLHAAINEVYARSRDYGFVYAHLHNSSSPCEYPRSVVDSAGNTRVSWRARAPTWCKVPLLAHVLLHGTSQGGRRCSNILYLDTDAHVSNFALSIDEYLERAKQHGDEALTLDNHWRLLFSSNYWSEPDTLNSGVLFVRNDDVAAGREACGLLRACDCSPTRAQT